MMAFVRRLGFAACVLAAFAACSSPSPREQRVASEIAAVTPLKQAYPGVLMGFDVRGETMLVASLDLQAYNDTDDDVNAAMRGAVVERWRHAWSAAHPGEHATLHVRFIDFIGRTLAEKTTTV